MRCDVRSLSAKCECMWNFVKLQSILRVHNNYTNIRLFHRRRILTWEQFQLCWYVIKYKFIYFEKVKLLENDNDQDCRSCEKSKTVCSIFRQIRKLWRLGETCGNESENETFRRAAEYKFFLNFFMTLFISNQNHSDSIS
jgi:hypothetical protein